jgi:transcription initiation factor TFIIIB Brf1 subunit/transcription initiation factor TFIIB
VRKRVREREREKRPTLSGSKRVLFSRGLIYVLTCGTVCSGSERAIDRAVPWRINTHDTKSTFLLT